METAEHRSDSKPQPKPSALTYWILLCACIVGGVALMVFGGGDGILFGICALIAGFILCRVHKHSSKTYSNYIFKQAQYLISLRTVVNRAIDTLEELSESQVAVQSFLDEAQVDFDENAYSPFWDAVENAAAEIEDWSEHLDALCDDLESYTALVSLYHGDPPQFPVSLEAFATLQEIFAENTLVNRLEALVRSGQQDYHFASIFEQRKTTAALVAGFASATDALDAVGNQITQTTDRVSALNATVSTHSEAIQSLMADIATQAGVQHEELMLADAQHAEREKEALEMLLVMSRVAKKQLNE